ncbi:MAG: transposase [Proteobacteria bacterium]|nr:transposase [Pseudomonadota bacterium]
MTSARSTKIDLNATPFYHCISRCVRRSYLCGIDSETGKDYSHRKKMILLKMKQLTEIFAIRICSYAIMSNHYHLVLFVNENLAKSWSEIDIKSRWAMLYPKNARKHEHHNDVLAKKKISEWRKRLTDISWFMKCLNETMARRCNKEDDCKGHFWEARFNSQALLDETAVLATMAYVDLNPIRAKIALTPETSEFTSIFERIKAFTNAKSETIDKTDIKQQSSFLVPFADNIKSNELVLPTIDFKFTDYLTLVDETGRLLREDKRGTIPNSLPPILQRLKLSTNGWLGMAQNFEHWFSYGIGNVSALSEFRSLYRKNNPKGLNSAKQLYIQVA